MFSSVRLLLFPLLFRLRIIFHRRSRSLRAESIPSCAEQSTFPTEFRREETLSLPPRSTYVTTLCVFVFGRASQDAKRIKGAFRNSVAERKIASQLDSSRLLRGHRDSSCGVLLVFSRFNYP